VLFAPENATNSIPSCAISTGNRHHWSFGVEIDERESTLDTSKGFP